MKGFLIGLFFLAAIPASSQKIKVEDAVKQLARNCQGDLLLVCRGSKTKTPIIAKQFNLMDTIITHIALGCIDNDSLQIFSVEDIPGPGSVLKTCSLESFIANPDIYYAKIWKTRLLPEEWKRIRENCREYSKRKINFDYSFRLNNGDNLYCSEFCAEVINKSGIERLRVTPVVMQLNNPLFESILQQKTLEYYPVDFFSTNPLFTQVLEWRF